MLKIVGPEACNLQVAAALCPYMWPTLLILHRAAMRVFANFQEVPFMFAGHAFDVCATGGTVNCGYLKKHVL